VTGVRLAGGGRIPADVVVSNADVLRLDELLDRRPRRPAPRETMSCFLLYLGTDRVMERLLHHTLLVGEGYREFIRSVTRGRSLPSSFSTYVHAPARTDAAMAPPDGDSLAVLLPVPNLRAPIDWSRAAGGLPVAAAGALGFGVELLGVATGRPFGHYTYSGKLGPRVGGVPLLAAAAWAMLARPSWVVAGLLSRRRGARVPLAAGALTAWDVFLDPRMAREGYWSWPGGGRYEGIPATNFLGWFVTGMGVFAVYSVLDPDDDPRVDGDGALALYVWTWAGEGFANAVLWKRPTVAAAGGVAMGVFAVQALARRAGRAG